MKKKILIMGLPGSGQTTLANAISSRLKAVHWNADDVRQTINSHLTFSEKDRIKQAETMKWLADRVVASGHFCVVDFICPTAETREAFDFHNATVIWVDRIKAGRFDDTNQLFEPPLFYDYHVVDDGRSAEEWADQILAVFLDWE